MKPESNSPAGGARRAIAYAGSALALGVALYFGWAGWRAHRGLVTLDVRDMDVRLVVKKIAWQTWDDIFVHQDVQGKVTLKVRDMPAAPVLALVAGQTSSRPSLLYPLYSKSESFTRLKKSLRGEAAPATHGWTNLQARAFFGGPGGGFGSGPGGGMPGQAQNQLVSLNLLGKDIPFATLAFNRFAQTRVVPEDGASATVSVIIKQASVSKAVAQLARAAHLKWAKVYALQRGFGGPPQFAGRDGSGPGRFPPGDTNRLPRFGVGGPDMTDAQREALEQELNSVLPAEARQKIEQAQQEREQQMQEMANMTDEQRRDRFMQMNGGGQMDKMMRDRIMNSTPEQRAQMNQRINQMRGESGGPPR